jgi:ABC-2 type transport system ATP-binding protein
MNLLSIQDLTKRYPDFELGPVTLAVPEGCIFGLIGPNGAGKTTLMDLIFGMGREDGGSIQVAGHDHRLNSVELKQTAAYSGPEISYVGWGKVWKAIRFIRGFRPTWDDRYADELMKGFGLEADARIGTLSFGGKTKLSLVMALAWRPKLLVLDEPTTGLDPAAKQFLFQQLQSMMEDGTRSVFISSHELGGLERYADRVAVLHRGTLAAEGKTTEILNRYVRVHWAESQAIRAEGIWIETVQDGSVTAMINTQKITLNELETRGATQITSQRLTLEDWFLVLTKNGDVAK